MILVLNSYLCLIQNPFIHFDSQSWVNPDGISLKHIITTINDHMHSDRLLLTVNLCWHIIRTVLFYSILYRYITHITMTTCLILCWSHFCCQKSSDPSNYRLPLESWRCAVLSVTKIFAADLLSLVSCEVWPPRIRIVCPDCPTDGRSDWDLGNLEASPNRKLVVLFKSFLNHLDFWHGAA